MANDSEVVRTITDAIIKAVDTKVKASESVLKQQIKKSSVSNAGGGVSEEQLANITALVNGKVSKVEGKGLSTNDYTAAEKNKLEGVAIGANNYAHPSYTAKSSGLYNVTVDATGHVSATSPVSKTDITGLGIPGSDTTYSDATTSVAGLMSSEDKIKLDSIAPNANAYSLPVAGASLGGVKSGTDITVDASGNVSVNDDTHNHIIANIDGLQEALDDKSGTDHNHDNRYYTESETDTLLNEKLNASLKGASSGLAELDANGKVLSSQLPSYVDDVIEAASSSDFPTTGETGIIYIAQDTNKTYRWSGTAYVEISASLALGETSSTAYRGDRGKVAYDHSQAAHAPTTEATPSASGLMSAEDKIKLDGIQEGTGSLYTHPESGVMEGTYNNVTVNAQGHVTAGNNVSYAAASHMHNGGLDIAGSATNTYIVYPSGGRVRATISSYTGYMKITLPVTWSNSMVRFTVDFYNYQTNTSASYTVGGYNYSSGTWINTFAYSVGCQGGRLSNLTVRLGHDGSKCAVYIGEANTSWNYTQVTVKDITVGYSGHTFATWASGWSVGWTTTLGTITATIANPFVSYSPVYTATLSTTWSGSGPYTQDVTVSGLLATDNPFVDVVLSATTATAKAQLEAWGCVDRIVTAANKITVYCYYDKPTTAIPIQLKVVR